MNSIGSLGVGRMKNSSVAQFRLQRCRSLKRRRSSCWRTRSVCSVRSICRRCSHVMRKSLRLFRGAREDSYSSRDITSSGSWFHPKVRGGPVIQQGWSPKTTLYDRTWRDEKETFLFRHEKILSDINDGFRSRSESDFDLNDDRGDTVTLCGSMSSDIGVRGTSCMPSSSEITVSDAVIRLFLVIRLVDIIVGWFSVFSSSSETTVVKFSCELPESSSISINWSGLRNSDGTTDSLIPCGGILCAVIFVSSLRLQHNYAGFLLSSIQIFKLTA